VSRASQDYLGSYRLLNLVRSGKTCDVWEALRDSTGERFALKVLAGEFAENKDEVAFLKHEIKVGQGLDHPRVIRVHDFGMERGHAYLVMELFPFPNLKQHIQQNYDRLLAVLSTCIEQAAEGLGYFHEQGWVHRDIKPDNFLMKPDGTVKLIDFALAQRSKHGLSRLFYSQKVLQGTRSYMSPEQIRMRPLDQRSDIYSFGCMLYELASGKLPFTGISTNELLNKHLKSPSPSIQAANRNITDDFAALVRRMLSKLADERPASMKEFLQDFRRLQVFKVPPVGKVTSGQ
jgi:eukaryotic-like serine/threonine-protein kinase